MRVRIENLPEDIDKDELYGIGSDFGKVVSVKVWSYQNRKYANLLYEKVRERGIPERINGNSLGAMVGPGPLGDAIVLLCCCFRGVACRPPGRIG